MKRVVLPVLVLLVVSVSCKKSDSGSGEDFNTTEQAVLTNFTSNVAVGGYKSLDDAATTLNNAIQALNTNATEANLTTARTAWKNMRHVWEQCEGFLFGPVEDNDYDPNMDTWPTDYVQ